MNRWPDHGELNGLTSLSDTAAESLSNREGNLELNGLTRLSTGAAESLTKHGKPTRYLYLYGLTSLSDPTAESLSKYEWRYLSINLDNLPASASILLINIQVFYKCV